MAGHLDRWGRDVRRYDDRRPVRSALRAPGARCLLPGRLPGARLDGVRLPAALRGGDPKQFVGKVNEDLRRLYVDSSTADWIKSTYITDDSERNAASANERLLAYSSEAARTATRFKDLKLDPDTARMLYLLRIASPVIEDPARRLEMTPLLARLEET